MKGVNIKNQLSFYYLFESRHIRCWRSVFIKILDIKMSNIYLFYKTFVSDKIS